MKNRLLPLLITVTAVWGCDSLQDDIDSRERELLEQFRWVDPPSDPSNQYEDDEAAVSLGHKLFYDTDLSGPLGPSNGASVRGSLGEPGESRTVACFTCHDLFRGGADTRSRPNATSLGAGWTGRNSPTVYNAVFSPWQFWDGRLDSVWAQAAGALEAGATHNGTRLEVAHTIYENYKDEYEAIFGALPSDLADTSSTARFPARGKPGMPAFDDMPEADRNTITEIHVNVAKAIAAYEKTLLCKDSPFDRWLDGDEDAMSAAAIRGARLFINKGACAECHSGPTFSDNEFHNTGTPQRGMHVSAIDVGRSNGIQTVKNAGFNRAGRYSDAPDDRHIRDLEALDRDVGAFKTPSLRCVEFTAPYKHNGVYETLWDVVEHYNFGGRSGSFSGTKSVRVQPLGMTDEEMDDVVEFMRALTGAPLPIEIICDPFSDSEADRCP